MRAIILGDTGSGKTLLAIDILREYAEIGFIPWSNVHLKGIDYHHIDGTDFITNTDTSKPNFILVDEVGEIARGICQYNFGQLMAQSRKSIGENQIFLMTAQVSQQTSNTMKGMVDYIIYPEILSWDSKDHRPRAIRADFYRKIPRMTRPEFEYYGKQYREVFETCDFYDTAQMIDPMEDGRFKKYLTEYEHYVDSKGMLTALSLILQEKKGLNITDSKRMARKIINARAWGLID